MKPTGGAAGRWGEGEERVVLEDEGGWGEISTMYQNQDGGKDMRPLPLFS